MKKTLWSAFLTIALILALIPGISQAKFSGSSSHSSYSSHSYSSGGSSGYSHSYSFGSSSSSGSSSYGGYSKPSSGYSSGYAKSTPSYSSSPSSGSSFGSYSKPSSSGSYVSTGSSAGSSGSYYNRKNSFAVSSQNYASMKSYSSHYSQPPVVVNHNYYSSPSYSHVYSTYGSANGYYVARQRDIGGWYSRYPEPAYVYHMHPNYGIWDSYFLYLMLQNAQNQQWAMWAYSHQNDPSYQQWYGDMQTQGATNPQVQAQLNTLNQQVAALQASHTAVQATDVLPPGVSSDIAVSPSAVSQDPSLNTDDGPGFFGWVWRILLVGAVLGIIAWVVKIVLFPAPKQAVRW